MREPKETVRGAEVVIEAITELPEAKRALPGDRPAPWQRHDPGIEHELSRRLPADPGGPAEAGADRALVHAALPRRPRRRRARPGDRAGVRRTHARADRRHGAGADRAQKFISGYIANRIQSAITLEASSSSTRATPRRARSTTPSSTGFPCASRSSATSPRPTSPASSSCGTRSRTAPTSRPSRAAGRTPSTGSSPRAAPASWPARASSTGVGATPRSSSATATGACWR